MTVSQEAWAQFLRTTIDDVSRVRVAAEAMLDELVPGEVPGNPAPADPPAEEPAPDLPPVDETPPPAPVPDPVPVPPAPPTVPATPSTGGPRGSRTLGRDITLCRDSGVVVTSSDVTFNQALPTFDDWDIGTRRLVFRARVGRVADIRSIDGNAGANPQIHIMPGGGFDVMEYISALDCRASMVLKQERGGVASIIRLCDMRGMSQDALKVSGGNLIEDNLVGSPVKRNFDPKNKPHADGLTAMDGNGGITFQNNDVNWDYVNTAIDDGINGWFRIEPYQVGAVYDDIIIQFNTLFHSHPNSFAMQVVEKNNPTWRGSVKVRDNKMQKAGSNAKIYYGATVSQRITEWSGNTDFAGNPIPISAI
jgi:hypothetical protein